MPRAKRISMPGMRPYDLRKIASMAVVKRRSPVCAARSKKRPSAVGKPCLEGREEEWE